MARLMRQILLDLTHLWPRRSMAPGNNVHHRNRLPANPLKRHFGRAKLKGCQILCGGLGGLRQIGYCAGVIGDASLVEDYGSIGRTY